VVRAGTMFLQRLLMSQAAVPFIASEAVLWELLVQTLHERITIHLGNDTSGRNRK